MNENEKFLRFSNNHEISESPQKFFKRTFSETFFTIEEECNLGDEALGTIKKGIRVYREEIIHQQVPDEVHSRLHSVIQRRWSLTFHQRNDEGR